MKRRIKKTKQEKFKNFKIEIKNITGGASLQTWPADSFPRTNSKSDFDLGGFFSS